MFEFIVSLFDVALYRPLFNALILIYNYLPGHDFGLAIVVLTIIIKLILYPLSVMALHSQLAMQRLQPKLQEIQKKHKDDKEAQGRATLELYRDEKINPFGGLMLMILQFPILIALYRVFWRGLKPEELGLLYAFTANPLHINPVTMGFLDLSQPNFWFAVLAGIMQFVQTKMLLPKKEKSGKEDDVAAMVQRNMVYLFPFITVIILLKLPAALGLYWIVSGIFSVAQQYIMLKKSNQA